MSTDRLIFIPWNKGTIGDFAGTGFDDFTYVAEYSEGQKANTHHKRSWTYVYLDSPGTPLSSVGLGAGVRIGVIGHGAVGDPNIHPPDHSGAAPVHYTAIVAGLMAQGLQKRYVGTVACNACYSALGAPPLAKLLARELWNQGYKATCVMGYKGSLQGAYVPNAAGGKYNHRTVTTASGVVKAKNAHERFWGFM